MKIVCYGDSNTWGYDPRNYFGGRYDKSWPELLGELSGWHIINQGKNGREISKICPQLPVDTDILIIMLGTNDLLQGCSPEAVCMKMEIFLLSMGMKSCKILLLSIPPMSLGEWVQRKELINDAALLAEYYEKLSKRLGVDFIDVQKWMFSLSFDGVHMTQEDHTTFAIKLYEKLKERLLQGKLDTNADINRDQEKRDHNTNCDMRCD